MVHFAGTHTTTDEHNRQPLIQHHQFVLQIESRLAGHVHVGQDHRRRLTAVVLKKGLSALEFFNRVARQTQQFTQVDTQLGVVIDQKNMAS